MILKYRKNYILKLFRQRGSPVPAHHCEGLFFMSTSNIAPGGLFHEFCAALVHEHPPVVRKRDYHIAHSKSVVADDPAALLSVHRHPDDDIILLKLLKHCLPPCDIDFS